ncbi:hypothetical protein, partial [Segeticoccus rhizosphaerae]|uniref:hypothetical protein n=1 Tax=Segeticoccus rhizosphaerae TaxID=1104777 RepID=UPI00139688FE
VGQSRLARQRLAHDRELAYHDARALAIELGRGRPRAPFDPMAAGVVLWPGEAVYRQVPLALSIRSRGSWATPSTATVLVTDQRLLCRFHSGCLASLPWRHLTGLHINLAAAQITLDYADGTPIALTGVFAPVIAVAAVACTYGPAALLTHPGLESLRH